MFFDIGITGLAGSGKNTLADVIDLEVYIQVSFAHTLKTVCKDYLGWDGQKDEKGRKLLQTIGMALREYNPDTWINLLENNLYYYREDKYHFIYTDVRFKNETDYIRNNGGIIIRVVRPSLELSDMHNHVSEAGQADIKEDYTVINDGTIDDLRKKVFNVIKQEQDKRKAIWDSHHT